MSRGKQLFGAMAGAVLPVAVTWATVAAANNGDLTRMEIRQHQLVISSAFPDCDNHLMTIRGFYFDRPGFPIEVSLEL